MLAPPLECGPTCEPGLGVMGQGGAGSEWEQHPSHHCFLPRVLTAGRASADQGAEMHVG